MYARWTRSVLLLTVAVLLAGCLGDEATVTPPEPQQATDDGTGAVPDGDVEADAVPEAQEVLLEVDGQGRTSMGVWLCDPAACQGEELEGGEFMVLFDYAGALTDVDLSVEWSASDPSLQTMYLEVRSEGDDSFAQVLQTTSASPAKLQADGLEGLPENATLHVHVWPVAELTTPAGNVYVDATRADFAVTGTLTTLIAAA